MDSKLKILSQNIKELIDSKRMSNNEFGRECGIGSSTVSNMINGTNFQVLNLLKVKDRWPSTDLNKLATNPTLLIEHSLNEPEVEYNSIMDIKDKLIYMLEKENERLKQEIQDLTLASEKNEKRSKKADTKLLDAPKNASK